MAWTYPNSLKLAMRGYAAAPESAAAAVRSAIGSGWKLRLIAASGGVASATPPNAATRKVLWRAIFNAFRAIKYGTPTPVSFAGTVRYYDPLGSAGSGTSYTDPTNTWPSTANAVLIREGRTHVGMIDIPIGGSVYQIGTYDAATGARVTDLNRVATIDANGAQFCITTQKSNFVVSGLAFKYSSVPDAIIRAFYASYGGGANSIIVEHFWVRDMLPLPARVDTSEAIYIRGKDAIVRHGWIDNCRSGGIYIGDNGGTGTGPENAQIYNNVIELNSGIAVNGPDPIQIASPGGTYGDCWVLDNWAVMPVNAKQVLVATSTGALTSPGTDSLLVTGNFFFGPDHTLTQIGPDATKTILSEVANTTVEGNVLECASWGVGLYGNGSKATGNVMIFDYSGKTGELGVLLQADDVLVRNNTLVVMPGTTLTEAFEHTGSGFTGCDISDNIVWNYGGTITYGVRRRTANCTEARNIVYGATNPFVDNGLATIAAGTGSVTSDPLLDGAFRPKVGSPALTGGGSTPTFVDPDNVTSDGSPFRGAYQTEATTATGPTQIATGTASGSLGGSNGGITGDLDMTFSAACNPSAGSHYGLLEKADGSTYLRGTVGLPGQGAEITLPRPAISGETIPATVAIVVAGGSLPAGQHVVAINCGGPAYVDGTGTQYLADIHFSGGLGASLPVDVVDTTDDALFATERYGAGGFSYAIPVAAGHTYEVELRFAEIYFSAPGDRVFGFTLQPGTAEEVVVEDIDIIALVGVLRTYSITRTVYVSGSTLNIRLDAQVQNPKVSAILVRSTDGGAYVPTGAPPTTSTWLELLQASVASQASTGIGLALAGGDTIPFNQPGTRFASFNSVRDGLIAQGQGSNPFASGMNALVPWGWVYALAGHTATNYGILVRRIFGQVRRYSNGEFEFIFKGGRGRAARWNGATPEGGFDYGGDVSKPDYVRDYSDVDDCSLAIPQGNYGFEMWAAPSIEDPTVGADPAYNAGKLNRGLIADCRNVCVGFEYKVVKLSGADADPSQIRFGVCIGWDFFWVGSGAPSARYLSGGWPGHAVDAGGSNWQLAIADGEWHWCVAIGGDFGWTDWNGSPWPNPNPYNNSPAYADTWADVVANPPINMLEYYNPSTWPLIALSDMRIPGSTDPDYIDTYSASEDTWWLRNGWDDIPPTGSSMHRRAGLVQGRYATTAAWTGTNPDYSAELSYYDGGAVERTATWNRMQYWNHIILGGGPKASQGAWNLATTNTRAAILGAEMWVQKVSSGLWLRVWASDLPGGDFYDQSWGAYDKNDSNYGSYRTENSGQFASIKLKTYNSGANFYFWHGYGVVQNFSTHGLTASDIKGVLVSTKMSLILDNPAGVDDRDASKYFGMVGADYYAVEFGIGGTTYGSWPGIGWSRIKRIAAKWPSTQWHVMHTMTEAQFNAANGRPPVA